MRTPFPIDPRPQEPKLALDPPGIPAPGIGPEVPAVAQDASQARNSGSKHPGRHKKRDRARERALAKDPTLARRAYVRHGATSVKVKLKGFNVLDQRTNAAMFVIDYKRDLIQALGGDDVTPQQATLADLAARSLAIVNHMDAYLFSQPSLVNDKGQVLDLVEKRTGAVNSLVRILSTLGLKRVAPRPIDVREYFAQKHRNESESEEP
jgi:hypothetical protein